MVVRRADAPRRRWPSAATATNRRRASRRSWRLVAAGGRAGRGRQPASVRARRAVTRRRGRAPAGADPFFDYFRAALARLPAGLVRVGPPADAERLARGEADAGRPLPPDYAAFLRSFDGADLFHETVVIAGVGPHAPLSLLDLSPRAGEAGPLVFATGAADERYALRDDGQVVRQDAGSDEQAVAGSGFTPWLDATVAAQQVLYGPDGEYAPDVFDPVRRGRHPRHRASPGRARAEAGSGCGGLGARRGAGAEPPRPLHAPPSTRSSARRPWIPTTRGSGSISGARRWKRSSPRARRRRSRRRRTLEPAPAARCCSPGRPAPGLTRARATRHARWRTRR